MENEKSLSSNTYRFSDENPRNIQRNVFPIGPRFQADLPVFNGQVDNELDTSRWLGTKVWPLNNRIPRMHNKNSGPKANVYEIGKGRTDVCKCQVPKSLDCLKRHVIDSKKKLRAELGPAFLDWKFDEMGEDALRDWTSQEKKKLESMMKKNPTWKKSEGFVEFASKTLPNKKREAIVRYYFNVIVPRKFSKKIKSGFKPTNIDTDDDDDDDEEEIEEAKAFSSKSSCTRKRSRSETKIERKYMAISR